MLNGQAGSLAWAEEDGFLALHTPQHGDDHGQQVEEQADGAQQARPPLQRPHGIERHPGEMSVGQDSYSSFEHEFYQPNSNTIFTLPQLNPIECELPEIRETVVSSNVDEQSSSCELEAEKTGEVAPEVINYNPMYEAISPPSIETSEGCDSEIVKSLKKDLEEQKKETEQLKRKLWIVRKEVRYLMNSLRKEIREKQTVLSDLASSQLRLDLAEVVSKHQAEIVDLSCRRYAVMANAYQNHRGNSELRELQDRVNRTLDKTQLQNI